MKWYLNAFIPPILLADILYLAPVPVGLSKGTLNAASPNTRVVKGWLIYWALSRLIEAYRADHDTADNDDSAID